MTDNVPSILCVGELVWDLFPAGPKIGGAPLNVAVHLARQGVLVSLLTAVGRDPLGTQALAFLDRERIGGAHVHPDLPTGTVKVDLDPGGVPRFAIHAEAAWTDLGGAVPAGDPLSLAHVAMVVFGGVAMHCPANRSLLGEFLQERPRDSKVIGLCDLNLRPGWSNPATAEWCARRADILKLNEEEFHFLAGGEATEREARRALLSRYDLQGLCVTLGPGGMIWTDASGEEIHLSPAPREVGGPVIDTVGAGDAVTAAIALGEFRGEPVHEFLERGRRWASLICGIPGALPSRPEETGALWT